MSILKVTYDINLQKNKEIFEKNCLKRFDNYNN